MTPSLHTVRPIAERHLAPTARLLARAMDVDPAYRYLILDEACRQQGLEDFFVRNLRLHKSHRCTHVGLDADGRVLATVTLRPPGGIPMSTLTMLRYGVVPFALQHGLSAVRRLLWLKDTYEGLDQALTQGRPHWYVHMMAVTPELQGRGLGQALLARVLDAVVEDDPSAPLVLTTHLPQNVTFYRRFGFQAEWERTVEPPGAPRHRVWGMARRA